MGCMFSYRTHHLGTPAEQSDGHVEEGECLSSGMSTPTARPSAIHSAHLAISIALFIMFNALPSCNEEEFWFSASVVDLVHFGDFLMQ